jgi:SAM-dependent methyltransferase
MLSLEKQNAYRRRLAQMWPGWQPATERYASLARQLLRPGGRVLDLGCGRGGLLEHLGDLSLRPVGLDADFASLAEHRLADLPRAAGLASALPFPAASFDLVAAAWVLEHLADPPGAFGEMARVLRPGGAFLFITPNAASPIMLLARGLRPLQTRLVRSVYARGEADTFPARYRANTRHAIERIAHAAGLSLERLLYVPDPTYLAFGESLFRLGLIAQRLIPPSAYVHLVGICRRVCDNSNSDSGIMIG